MINDFIKVNYTKGGMKEIRGVVFHSTAGFYDGTRSWFKNPKAQVSAHYVISEDGEVCHMVDEARKDCAWHAGGYDKGKLPTWCLPNANFFTIGVEIVDMRKSNWDYPKAQRDALKRLVAQLMKKYKIPYKRLLTHKQIRPSTRHDPVGKFDLNWFKPTASKPYKAIKKEILKDKEVKKTYKETPIVPLETPQPLVVDGISDHTKVVVATQDITPKNLLERIIKFFQDALNEIRGN